MEAFLGQIQLFSFGWAPNYWLPCEGQLLQISSNQALYSLIGTKFGGDGQTTFAVPDLRNCSPNSNMTYCICIMGIYPSRQ